MYSYRYSPGLSVKGPFQVLAQNPTHSCIWAEAATPPASTYISDRFGIRLRTLRKERGLTQLNMATQFGMDRSFISELERGKTAISLTSLEVIAMGFGLTLSELLSDI
jgi:DNA-binding XRE family transcriptional regulator